MRAPASCAGDRHCETACPARTCVGTRSSCPGLASRGTTIRRYRMDSPLPMPSSLLPASLHPLSLLPALLASPLAALEGEADPQSPCPGLRLRPSAPTGVSCSAACFFSAARLSFSSSFGSSFDSVWCSEGISDSRRRLVSEPSPFIGESGVACGLLRPLACEDTADPPHARRAMRHAKIRRAWAY